MPEDCFDSILSVYKTFLLLHYVPFRFHKGTESKRAWTTSIFPLSVLSITRVSTLFCLQTLKVTKGTVRSFSGAFYWVALSLQSAFLSLCSGKKSIQIYRRASNLSSSTCQEKLFSGCPDQTLQSPFLFSIHYFDLPTIINVHIVLTQPDLTGGTWRRLSLTGFEIIYNW